MTTLTDYRIIGTYPGAPMSDEPATPGSLAKIIGRQCKASFDAMREHYARDDNRRWVPREDLEDYEERRDAGAACALYEPSRHTVARAVGLSLGIAAVAVIAVLIAGRGW